MISLTTLPVELRLTIYELLLSDLKLTYSPANPHKTRSRTRFQPTRQVSILLICRLTYAECYPLLLQKATINITALAHSNWPPLTTIRLPFASSIQHVAINMPTKNLRAHGLPVIHPGRFRKAMKSISNLKSLTIKSPEQPFARHTISVLQVTSSQTVSDYQAEVIDAMRMPPTFLAGPVPMITAALTLWNQRNYSFNLFMACQTSLNIFTINERRQHGFWSPVFEAEYDFQTKAQTMTSDSIPGEVLLVNSPWLSSSLLRHYG